MTEPTHELEPTERIRALQDPFGEAPIAGPFWKIRPPDMEREPLKEEDASEE